MYFNIVFLSGAYKSTKNIVLFCIYYIFYLIKIFNCIYHYLLCVKLYFLFCDVILLIDFVVTRKKTDVQIGHLFRNHSLNEFSVLHTLEIITSIRIPDFRPTCSWLFIPLIESLLCLQAVTVAFYGGVIIII